MASIENISVGDYLVVIDDDYRPEKFLPNAFQYSYIEAVVARDAVPAKVVAVSAPFVLCERLGESKGPVTVDCRFSRWTKVDGQFVSEFCRLSKILVPEDARCGETDQEASKKICPICLGKMSEVRTDGKWCLACGECQMKYVPMK